MRIIFCCLLANLLIVTNMYAEETLPLSEKEGRWSFTMGDFGADLKSVSKENQKKIRGSLQEIARVVTATPPMNPPKGFEARFWGSMTVKDRFYICSGKKCPPSRPTAVLAMMLGRYEEKDGRIKAAFNSPSTMDISTNNLGHVFANLPVLYRDDGGYLLPEPQLDGERAGMRTFSNKGHAVAVMTRSDKPLWAPVSRERYLQAAIADAAKAAGETPPPPPVKKGKKKPAEADTPAGKPILIEEGRSWIDPAEEKKWVEKSRSLTFDEKESMEASKDRLQKLREELAGMPAEERAMTARVDIEANGDLNPPLLPAESSSGVAVVTPDFGYFNPKLPPEAIQLIVVQWKFDGNPVFDPMKSDITETLNNLKLLEIYKTMDWQKLSNKINRTGP